MRRLIFFFVLLLASCDRPPDFSNGTTEIWWNGHQPIPADQATDIVLRQGLLICPNPKVLADNWCAKIKFLDAGFKDCNGYVIQNGYAGCQPFVGDCEYWVGWQPLVSQTALIDEEAHYIWELCFNSTGEDCWKVEDGGDLNVCSEKPYSDFVGRTRKALIDAGL